MSVPADALTKFGMYLQNNPLLMQGLGIIAASGPSRTPTNIGGVVTQGLGTSNELQMQNLQRQQQQAFWQMMQPAVAPQPGQSPQPQPPRAPAPQGPVAPADPSADVSNYPGSVLNSTSPSPLAKNPLNSGPQPIPGNPLTPAVPNNAAAAPGISPQTSLRDPTQDPRYQNLMQRAMVMDYFKPGSGDSYRAQAQALLNEMQNEEVTLSPDEVNSFVPGGGIRGVTYQFSPYTGKVSTVGEGRFKDITYQDGTSGQMIHASLDQATGKVSPYDIPGQPTPGQEPKPKQGDEVVQDQNGNQVVIPAQYAAQVHKIASYDEAMPSSYGRNPVLSANMNKWVSALNPDWSQGQYQAKNDLLKSAAAGGDAKQLDAFNTIQSHLATLKQAWSALQNGDIQGANKLANWAGVQFGSDTKNNANIVNTLVSRELGKVLASGGNFTDSDKKEANSVLSTSLSPAQQGGAIDYIQKLIGGKSSSIVQRFKANKFSDGDIRARFNNDAWNAYQNFEGSQPQTGGASTNDPLGIR